ncbi:MAG: DNA/RNA non-specific endonuclease [Alistipes sp.]
MKAFRIVFIMMLTLVLTACSKDSDAQATSAAFRYTEVDCETTQNQLLLAGDANLTYTATIVRGAEWLSFVSNTQQTTITGAVTPVVFVYLQRNTTPDDRKAEVSVKFSNGETYEVSMTQQKYTTSALFDKGWAEQPEYKVNTNYVYKTYYTTLANAKNVRSYSICYDRTKKVSQWVAYPLHDCYLRPNVGRTDAWAYDPNKFLPIIPESDQQYVIESYRTGYARGHQCPSADRYSNVPTNEQTFYATNMMPQNGGFNGGIWASLESKVRDNVCNDTLYVVTGTYFANTRTTTDRKGNTIGLPSNCWKVLLRTKSGNTKKRIEECTADELMGIGFWFANDDSNTNNLPTYSRSIADIEKQTGFTFFRNLSADATAVKAQNDPSAWKIR